MWPSPCTNVVCMTTSKKQTSKKPASAKAPAKKKPAAKKPAAKKPTAKKTTPSVKDSAASYVANTEEFLKAWDATEIEKQIDKAVPDTIQLNTVVVKSSFKKFLKKLFK